MSRPFPGGGGDVESGRGGRDRASSGDPGGAAASGQQTSSSSYGSLRDDRRGGAAARGDYVVPQYHRAVPEESAVARCFRVSEPIIFWTACTLIAAFSCISMIRITRSPHFPASLPEGRDGRTVQVGYVANSTEALESYEGCRVTRGGSKLRNDMGVRRFPDFIVAGARGAPLDDLHRLLSEKNVACAATDEDDGFFHDPRWRRDPIPLEDQTEYLKRDYDQCGKEERWLGVPRFQTSRDAIYHGWAPDRMCEAMGGDETRVVLVLPDPVDHALAVFSQKLEPHKDTFHRWIERAEDSSRAVHASATTTKKAAAAAKEEEEEAGSRSAEEAGSRAAASSAAASAAASSDSKRTSSGESSSSSEGSSSASSPSSTSARVGAGAGIQFRGDDYDFGGDGNASDSDEPSDDSGEASDSDDAVSSLGRLVGRARTGSEATRAGSSASSSGAPAIPFTPAGFEIVARLDLAIATACGSEFLLPAHDAESRRAFLELKTCCAAVAKKHGYARWPGCGECASSLGGDTDEPTGEFKKCERDGELAFSPVRAGVYRNHLARFYRRVKPANVMVVTADQAWESGMATLAMAVVEWRLLGLPLVDPVSVTTDLMMAQSRASAGARVTAAAKAFATEAAEARAMLAGGKGVRGGDAVAGIGKMPGRRGAGAGEKADAPNDGGGGFASVAALRRRGRDSSGRAAGIVAWARRFVREIAGRALGTVGADGFAAWGWTGSDRRESGFPTPPTRVREAAEKQRDAALAARAAAALSSSSSGGKKSSSSDEDPDAVAGMGLASGGGAPSGAVSGFGNPLPLGFDELDSVSDDLRRELRAFYDPSVDALNALIGNGEIRWWNAEGEAVKALQEETLLKVMPPPPSWSTWDAEEDAWGGVEEEEELGDEDEDDPGAANARAKRVVQKPGSFVRVMDPANFGGDISDRSGGGMSAIGGTTRGARR